LTNLFDGDVTRAAAALDQLNAEIAQTAGRFF
jgi:hypothetical protein